MSSQSQHGSGSGSEVDSESESESESVALRSVDPFDISYSNSLDAEDLFGYHVESNVASPPVVRVSESQSCSGSHVAPMGAMDGWDISDDGSNDGSNDPDLHDVTGIGGSSKACWDLSDSGSNDDFCDTLTSKSEGVNMGSSVASHQPRFLAEPEPDLMTGDSGAWSPPVVQAVPRPILCASGVSIGKPLVHCSIRHWHDILWEARLPSRMKLPVSPMRVMKYELLCGGTGAEVAGVQVM